MKIQRITVIGIDGSGKSTTTLRAIYSLSHYIPICRVGRNPFSIWKGDISQCLPEMANFFESLFKRVDATKKRQWIGLTRLLFVFFQGWLEPYMIKKYRPGLVMATRCMIIDSAIYSDFYYPWISRRMTIESKLRFPQLYSRLPFRDLYFFLWILQLRQPWSESTKGSPMTILRSLTEGTTGFIFMSMKNLSGHWIRNSG